MDMEWFCFSAMIALVIDAALAEPKVEDEETNLNIDFNLNIGDWECEGEDCDKPLCVDPCAPKPNSKPLLNEFDDEDLQTIVVFTRNQFNGRIRLPPDLATRTNPTTSATRSTTKTTERLRKKSTMRKKSTKIPHTTRSTTMTTEKLHKKFTKRKISTKSPRTTRSKTTTAEKLHKKSTKIPQTAKVDREEYVVMDLCLKAICGFYCQEDGFLYGSCNNITLCHCYNSAKVITKKRNRFTHNPVPTNAISEAST